MYQIFTSLYILILIFPLSLWPLPSFLPGPEFTFGIFYFNAIVIIWSIKLVARHIKMLFQQTHYLVLLVISLKV